MAHSVNNSTLKLAIVAGEDSGDQLGADLVKEMKAATPRTIDLVGIGGTHLAAQGLRSLFDPHEIALMGFTAIVKKLPRLISLINQTADTIVAARPDALVIIDSPDFTHRVARKVKARLPNIVVVNYVCPSVWAWRQGRASAMRGYIDHVLAILPFEPDFLARIGGPEATYVGHRLATDAAIGSACNTQMAAEPARFEDRRSTLLLLPGSRRGEIRRMLPVVAEVVSILGKRNHELNLLLPTLPELESEVRAQTRNWPTCPEIASDTASKFRQFATADAALAASGTVTLELALSRVPTIAFYKTDLLARYIIPLINRSWSGSLPNLIADEPIVPESYNEQANSGRLARQVEQILRHGPERLSQLQGFDRLRKRMATDRSPGAKSASIVLDLIDRHGSK